MASGWRRNREQETALHERLAGVWPEGMPQPMAYRHDEGRLNAIVAREPVGVLALEAVDRPDLRWHVSVAHDERVPDWGELVLAGHELRPGVVFCVGLPPKSWWMNVHPHVLHLWELRDGNLVEQWRMEQTGGRTPHTSGR
jgi:hypothetical protein